MLEEARRPLFLIGHGVRIAGATEQFRKLAQQLNVPCVFTWNASDTLEWDSDLYIGRPGVVAARAHPLRPVVGPRRHGDRGEKNQGWNEDGAHGRGSYRRRWDSHSMGTRHNLVEFPPP